MYWRKLNGIKSRKGKIKMKVDWGQKLSSRKFWAAIIGFATALLIAFGVDDMTIEQVVAVISASAVIIAYIFGEGMVDASRNKKE